MLSAYMIVLKYGQHDGRDRGDRGLEGISIPADQHRVESLGLIQCMVLIRVPEVCACAVN